ncbi:ABC transporter ATP-binding protein/permease [Paenibacillus sp. MER 180]|uniref:ABC transporter ATP-binding protein n=1 Tax=unclassified Paenibacillus TaxID=185978 RepID=UPI000806715F|nr:MULTISPECIES: ABC transporter ATP-binding protein [unclassified Paenibacillus]MCM3291602.1 ABC transporter ATP-binding protein/permease [Paenibacillus sp. MER 180]OBY78850.1 hypothetical protein BBG47_14430 [Paenibacillus sp. KS1]
MNTKGLIWSLIKYTPGLYSLNLILAVFGWTLFLVPAYVSGAFFDVLNSGSPEYTTIIQIIIILFTGQFVRILLITVNIPVDVTFKNKVGALLRTNMLKQIFAMPAAQALNKSAGEAITSFREDVDDTVTFPGYSSLLDVIGAAVFSLAAFVIMLRIDVMITLIVVIPLIIIMTILHITGKRIVKYRVNSRHSTDAITGFIGDMFSSVQTIQLTGSEKHVLARFAKLSKVRHKFMVKEAVYTSFLNSIFTNIVDIGAGVILLLAANSIRNGNFTIGDFAVFTYYLTWISQLIKRFGSLSAQYRQVNVSVERLQSLIQEKMADKLVSHNESIMDDQLPEYKSSATNRDRLKKFTVNDVTFTYPQSNKGLKNISFELERGSVTVLTGKVGSGKSTLLKTVVGHLPLTSGSIKWNECEITNNDNKFESSYFSYAPQLPVLFSESLKENILLGCQATNEQLHRVIDITELNGDIQNFKDGIDTVVGPRGASISGGQKKRTSLARMLLRDMELLVMDDPTAGLDLNTELRVWNNIVEMRGTKTILVSSHRPYVLQHADHIIVLENGEIIEQGKSEQVLEWMKNNQYL